MKNTRLFYIIRFLETFAFTSAIWSFFFTSYLHFSFGQALFIMTIGGIVSVIFEVPSGAWADRFGRKKTYLAGTILLIIDLIIWLFANQFWIFIVGGVIAGLGNAMVSGNLEAILHDELQEDAKEKDFKDIAANSYMAIFTGRALATAVSGFLFVLHPLLPIFLTLVSTTSILLFAYFLHEPKQILSKHPDNLSHLRETFSFLKKNPDILRFIIFIGLLSGIGNIYFFTQQPYFQGLGLRIEIIAITFSLGAIISALGTFLFKKISNYWNEYQLLTLMIVMALIASIFYRFFDLILALVGLVLLSLMFGYVMTLGNTYLIHRTPHNQKSTMLSLFSFSITIGYSFFNILLSLTDKIIELRTIYTCAFGLMTILLVVQCMVHYRK